MHRHLLDYQDQLDAARDKIAEGDITMEQLDALDADLLDAMPDAVRAHAGIAPRTPAPNLAAQFKNSLGTPNPQPQIIETATPTPAPI